MTPENGGLSPIDPREYVQNLQGHRTVGGFMALEALLQMPSLEILQYLQVLGSSLHYLASSFKPFLVKMVGNFIKM